jgi:hypothetical protein
LSLLGLWIGFTSWNSWPRLTGQLLIDGVISFVLLAVLICGLVASRDKFNSTILFVVMLPLSLLIILPFLVTVILVVKEKSKDRS